MAEGSYETNCYPILKLSLCCNSFGAFSDTRFTRFFYTFLWLLFLWDQSLATRNTEALCWDTQSFHFFPESIKLKSFLRFLAGTFWECPLIKPLLEISRYCRIFFLKAFTWEKTFLKFSVTKENTDFLFCPFKLRAQSLTVLLFLFGKEGVLRLLSSVYAFLWDRSRNLISTFNLKR